MNRRGLALYLLLALFVPLCGAAEAGSDTHEAIALSCELGFLHVAYPGGALTSTGFRGSVSFTVGEGLYPGYARLLLGDLEATISSFPVFVDPDGDGVMERRLIDDVTLSEADVRWVHGGIHLATGEFILYLHLLVSDLSSRGIVAFEPQYVRLVLCGTLRPGAASLSERSRSGPQRGAGRSGADAQGALLSRLVSGIHRIGPASRLDTALAPPEHRPSG